MEEGLLKASMPGFWGGENSDWPQHELLPYQCRRIVNAVIDSSGTLTGRGGVKKLTATPLASGQPILSGYRYYNPSTGEAKTLVQAGRLIYVLADDGTSSQLSIGPSAYRTGGGMASGRRAKWQTCFATSKCIFSNGALYQYDGTTAEKVTATNAPTQIMRGVENKDKFWCWSKDQPNHVYRSPQQTVTDAWDSLEYSPVRPVDGDSVVDLTVLADWVLVLKERSLWRFDGSTRYDLTRTLLCDRMGMVGDTLAMYKGAASWLSPEGVVHYDGSSNSLPSNISANKINNAIFLYPNSILRQAVGHFYAKRQLYLLSLPFMSPPTVFVFHMGIPNSEGNVFGPVTRWEFPFAVTAMWSAEGVDDKDQLYLGSADGNAYLGDYGWQDDGAAISGNFETSYSTLLDNDDAALPDRIKNVRHLLFDPQIHGTLNLELLGDYGSCVWPADGLGFTTPDYSDPNVLVWGAGEWGNKNWAGPLAPMRNVRVSKFNASRVALRASWSTKNQVTISPPTVRYFARDARRQP